jgi:translation initiation factor 1
VNDCKCSSRNKTAEVPPRLVATLRIEKAGRGGKTVTVIDGLPQNDAFLRELLQDLKRACGCGGAVREGGIELQGDLRERVRAYLARQGHGVKG